MSMRKLTKILPAAACLIAATIVMAIGLKNENSMNYIITAFSLAFVGLILSISLQSAKSNYQEQLDAIRKRKRKENKAGGILNNPFYKKSGSGSLDNLSDDDISKKL